MNETDSRSRPRWRVWVIAALALPLLYVGSVGPMAPILVHECGDAGCAVWDRVYFRPLSKLPRGGRELVNKYIGFCDTQYIRWKIQRTRR